MTDAIAADDAAALQTRLDALEAENARLRAGNDAAPDRAMTGPAGSRWRAFFSALCIVIAGILVPISIVAAWARLELVDESAFVQTLAPLADDPAVQQMIIDETVEAVQAQVDFEELTANVFEGIDQLGLPPRASQALQLLQAPAAEGLQNLLAQTVTRVVESDAFADTWTATTRAAHRALTTAATSDGGGIVVMNDQGLGIQLGAIVERVKQNLVDRGVGIAQLIPAVDRVVIIGTGDTLVSIRTAYAIATTLGWWLPIITIGLFVLGILIARRRSTAVLGTGIAFAIGGGVLALAFAIGYPVVGQTAAQLGVSAPAIDVVYQSLIGSMQQTASIAVLLGLVIAVIGWFAGRWAPAARSRRAVASVNSSLRRQLAGHGLRTGRFGAWLYRYRALVRTLIIVLAVIWLFALRPLSAGDVFLVLIVALLVAWILELLQVRPDEAPAVIATEDEVVPDESGIAGDADTLVIDADTVVVGAPDTVDTEVIDGTPGAAAGPAAAPGSTKRP
ncbi:MULTISPECIES: hypothetical protein [Microbacterium]|uniref:hypothetical protein n=1 Tax=Microbacterium TaxID=33882 RepID=UPI000D65E71A|nr:MULTISPECIES: hypothetical protein [Microbacterium]